MEKGQQAREARLAKALAVVHDYERNEPTAVKFVAECLAKTNTTMDQLLVNWLTEDGELTIFIDRTEQRITAAEHRRNAMLCELGDYRRTLAQELRRALHLDGNASPAMIEATPNDTENAPP